MKFLVSPGQLEVDFISASSGKIIDLVFCLVRQFSRKNGQERRGKADAMTLPGLQTLCPCILKALGREQG